MNGYTPMQTLSKIHRELWLTIGLVGSLTVRLDGKSALFTDLCEVEKVLRASAAEVSKIIKRETAIAENSRKVRQGSDLALKAQLAKARQAVADAVKDVPDWPSHK